MEPRPRSIGRWNPEQADTEPSNPELVRDFLLVTEALPRDQVAEIAGIGRVTLSKWERGLVRNLRQAVRRQLVRYLRQWERARAGRRRVM